MAKFRMLDGSGHTEVEFDLALPETVSLVEGLFAEAKARGFSILERTGNEFAQVKSFNPKAEEIVAVPQIAGG